MRPVLKIFNKKPFELRIWLASTSIASLRTLISLFIDLNKSPVLPKELFIDLSLFFIFTLIFILIYIDYLKQITIIASIYILILGFLNFIQFGGVKGTSEFNFMAIGLFLILVSNKKWLKSITVIFLSALLIAVIDTQLTGIFSQNIFLGNSKSLNDFIFTTIAVTAVGLYFKRALVNESGRLIRLKKLLKKHNLAIKNQTKSLKKQEAQLRDINYTLEKKIQSHTHHLVKKNESIQQYIALTTESLHKPMTDLLNKVSDIKQEPDNPYSDLLVNSINDLNTIIQKLKKESNRNETV